MDDQIKEHLDSVMFGYTTTSHQLEGENKILRETISQLQSELNRFREPALMVCEVVEVLKDKGIIKTPNGNKFYVNVSSSCENLRPGDTVLTEQKNLTVIKKINTNKKFNVEKFIIMDKPDTKWEQIGGLDEQIAEIKEVIEMPLKFPQLFKKVGIQPPKGILLHGFPGTGKTILAKAVANSTNSTFIEIVASELVQKYIGEGAKLVKEIFQLAREKAPSIVFIDEIDALASKRIEVGTSGEREVQRTFMQLLSELDGFKPLGNVKVIGCTNRLDILDPAIIRPGRLDRLIEVPLPKDDGIHEIFKIHTSKMSLDKSVTVKALIPKMDGFSGADIKAVATEAGYFAIRDKRHKVNHFDLSSAVEKVKLKGREDNSHKKIYG